MPVELLGKSEEELRELLVPLGEPAYRGRQSIGVCEHELGWKAGPQK